MPALLCMIYISNLDEMNKPRIAHIVLEGSCSLYLAVILIYITPELRCFFLCAWTRGAQVIEFLVHWFCRKYSQFIYLSLCPTLSTKQAYFHTATIE